MMTIRDWKWTAVLLCGAVTWLLGTPSARANLEECGGVYLFAEAQCEFQATEECMTECMAVAVETSCAAQIYGDCEGGCTVSASAECESGCSDVCTTDCEETTAAEQPPNCMGLCMSDCQQSCTDSCAGANNHGPCRACCAHTCGDKCEAQCKDEPEAGVVECAPTCTRVCAGSCSAQANVDCQVDCQTRVYARCEGQLVERCESECKTTGGAIFCDGQFLNAGDLQACVDELASEIDIHIELDLDADLDISGSDTLDEIGNKVDNACAVAHVGSASSGGHAPLGVFFGLLALGAVWRFRTQRGRGRRHY